MMRNGKYYPLPPLVPRTIVKGCSLLPTPTVTALARPLGFYLRSGESWESTSNLSAYLVGLEYGLTGRAKRPHGKHIAAPSFIEWMMGTPEGWTILPIVGMSAVPACDMAVAAYCQRFIPANVRARCGLGVLAYHPSLLPRHRGRDAVRWTIAMREPVAGGSVYWMDDGADTGPIEAQDWCHVMPGEDAAALWRRELAPMGVRLLIQAVSRLAGGERPRAVPQDERAATWEPAFTRQRLSA